MALRHDFKFVKSFSRYEPTKLGYGVLVGSLMISFGFLALFEPLLCPLPISNFQLSMRAGLSMLMIEHASDEHPSTHHTSIHQHTNSSQRVEESKLKEYTPMCNISIPRSDFCEANGDIRIRGNSSTIVVATAVRNESWPIRPYARKGDGNAMGRVKELTVRSLIGNEEAPTCTLNHSVPAVVFSVGGYTGNLFHDFTDVVIPLFITSRPFDGEVQFVTTDSPHSWWAHKYLPILKHLSRYEIINLNQDNRVHCFQNLLVGLRCHKELSIDPSKSKQGYSMSDFGKFLRGAYGLERETAIRVGDGEVKKPRLLIVSRKRSRSFVNEGKIVGMAKHLGFEVVVVEANLRTNMSEFARIVNSCDVMMGVHGAGLTNLVFLPSNAVLIQIVPFGRMEWFARADFGVPAQDMKLRYLEYRVRPEESSLIEQYPRNHTVFTDPVSIHRKGWLALRSVYLDQQNVKPNIVRLKSILLKALELLHH